MVLNPDSKDARSSKDTNGTVLALLLGPSGVCVSLTPSFRTRTVEDSGTGGEMAVRSHDAAVTTGA